MDYFSHTKNASAMLDRLASTKPTTLACMHGSAWRGDGAVLLRALADELSEMIRSMLGTDMLCNHVLQRTRMEPRC